MSDTLPEGPARALIERFGMEPIPDEGAWFVLEHVAAERVAEAALPARYAGAGSRPLGNSILALVTRRDFSAMHRLRADETWHFYSGDALELLLLRPDGRAETVRLGGNFAAGERPQFTVPAGAWMGARPARDAAEAYSFFGCTLAPGFDAADYEPGWRDEMEAGWPEAAEMIRALTRPAFFTRPAGGAAGAPEIARGRVVRAGEPAVIAPGGGVELREIVGRAAAARTGELSVTRFRLEAGASSGSSRYHGADEHFYVLSGRGTAEIGGRREAVAAGDTVVIRRGEPHAMTADAAGPLEFLAIIAPAFDPASYAPER